MGKRTRSYEATLEEQIRRLVNNPAIKGSERIKVLTLAVKWYAVKQNVGTSEHGSGFASIDADDEEPDETTDETLDEMTDEERGARNGHDGGSADGDPDREGAG